MNNYHYTFGRSFVKQNYPKRFRVYVLVTSSIRKHPKLKSQPFPYRTGGLGLLAVGTVTHLAGSATVASTIQWNSSIGCKQEAEKRLAEALKLEHRLFEFEADILLCQTQIEQLEKDITETELQISRCFL